MRVVPLVLLFLLAGCQKDFEQRYDDIESEVKKDAARIDEDIRNNGAESQR